MTSPAPASRPARKPALVVVDIAASVLLMLFTISLALVVITAAVSYQQLAGSCAPGCNGGAIVAVSIIMIVFAVLAPFLAVGFVIVGMIRKRYTVLWPIAAAVVLIATAWIGTFVVGTVAG